jgi:ABC-type uncharacterized transport system YnjBCD ATPase subunit
MVSERTGDDRLCALGLTLAFGARVVQRDLNFSVRRGSIFAVMGGSGCGKSTVLKAMVGLLRPSAGIVLVDGEDYWAAAEARRAEIGRRFGVLFQSGAIGAPVTFRGVRVGSVERMALHLSTEGRARIPVTLELLPGQVILEEADAPRGTGLERLVAAGLRAQLVLQSFVTGQLRVDLDFRPGTQATRVAADTEGLPQIPALPSDLERLRETLSEVPVQDLAQTTQRVLRSIDALTVKLEAELGHCWTARGAASTQPPAPWRRPSRRWCAFRPTRRTLF